MTDRNHPRATTPDDPLADHLRDHLRSRADRLDVPAGDVGDVVGRGRRQQWARRAAGAAAVLAVAAGSVAVISNLSSDESGPSIADQPPTLVTPTPSPSTAPDTTPNAADDTVPAPSAGTSPTPSDAPTASPGSVAAPAVLVATGDGVVRWQDGATTPVAGIDSPVDLAVDDGRGGIVFQRNDIGIGRLVDGKVTTIAAASEFGARQFEGGEPIPAVRLRLWGAADGRIIYTVLHQGEGGPPPQFFDVLVEETTTDGSRTELGTFFAFENSTTAAAGGDRTVISQTSEAGAGSVSVDDDGGFREVEALAYAGEGSFDSDLPYSNLGPQLSRDGQRIAVVQDAEGGGPFTLRVLDLDTSEVVVELPLAGLDGVDGFDFPVVTDLVGDTAVIGDSDPSAPGRPVLVDLGTGRTTTIGVTGRATFAR